MKTFNELILGAMDNKDLRETAYVFSAENHRDEYTTEQDIYMLLQKIDIRERIWQLRFTKFVNKIQELLEFDDSCDKMDKINQYMMEQSEVLFDEPEY